MEGRSALLRISGVCVLLLSTCLCVPCMYVCVQAKRARPAAPAAAAAAAVSDEERTRERNLIQQITDEARAPHRTKEGHPQTKIDGFFLFPQPGLLVIIVAFLPLLLAGAAVQGHLPACRAGTHAPHHQLRHPRGAVGVAANPRHSRQSAWGRFSRGSRPSPSATPAACRGVHGAWTSWWPW